MPCQVISLFLYWTDYKYNLIYLYNAYIPSFVFRYEVFCKQ